MSKKLVILLVILLVAVFTLGACSGSSDKQEEIPVNFRIITPEVWELEVGDSRSVDYAFASGVTNRSIEWSVSPADRASVDEWGRVTALKEGAVIVRASAECGSDSAILNVVTTSYSVDLALSKVDYSAGSAVALGDNLQKIVTRYEFDDPEIPAEFNALQVYTDHQTVTKADGVVWTITDYGVLRTDSSATLERDVEQRFMGDRYFFYYQDAGDSVNDIEVLAIYDDGEQGIWTMTEDGITHIEMVEMTGEYKAAIMSATTSEYVSRNGMVSESYYNAETDTWTPNESDNDGLWTSMYAAGELMRYSVLKDDPTATAAEIQEALDSAMIATEAVLLLSNISMRTGTVQAYIRYQPNAKFDTDTVDDGIDDSKNGDGRFLSDEALEVDGDASLNLPMISPAEMYEQVYEAFVNDGAKTYIFDSSFMTPYSSDSWSNPNTSVDTEYETRTRNLEGYIARTYSFDGEYDKGGYIYWEFNADENGDFDGTATGISTKNEFTYDSNGNETTTRERGYYLNGENLRGVVVDASGEVPTRLLNDLLDEGYSLSDIAYKGDTSSDEIIGHLFLYKLAYDILGPVDAELKEIISNTMERFAQHVSDNSYMMVDGSGQPGTWSKFNRDFFYNSSQMGGAPLTCSVLLNIFKVAYYVTGNVKWEQEYRMAALDTSYEYARLTSQYAMQCELAMYSTLEEVLVSPALVNLITSQMNEDVSEMLIRLFLNYSDEEMAMLSFYLLFQLETDEVLLSYYRTAIDGWWKSIKYSENPLWYYIYQLAYPDKTITDAFGNNILETAAWSLSRHPIDTQKYLASNINRDDYAELDMADLGFGDGTVLCYKLKEGATFTPSGNLITDVGNLLQLASVIEWGVAAPDERALHKYNGASYSLDGHYEPNCMEGSTTYTLPYWLGRYHNMLS